MNAGQAQQLFARAERSLAAGQAEAALGHLRQLRQLVGKEPAVLHLTALAEKRRGDAAAARAAFEAALEVAPGDPQINNNFATLLDQTGQPDAALLHYGRAIALAPRFADARYNRALLLERLGRSDEALVDLDEVLRLTPASARAFSAKGSVLRSLGRLTQAAEAYDQALRLEPMRPTALHGRARTALERGEEGAAERYRKALQASPGSRELLLGLAEAMELEGDAAAPATLARAVAADPKWLQGQAVLARMRWEAGEGKEFARDIESAVRAQPGNAELWVQYTSSLAAANLRIEAADVAAQGWAGTGDARLLLIEAVQRSESGDLDRADALFAAVAQRGGGAEIYEARHRLRRADFHHALDLVDQVRARQPWDVAAWALTALLWRIVGHPQAAWLAEQDGLVATRELDLSAQDLVAVAGSLRQLHKSRAHPLGQSLRGGSQTRGRLFERPEPELQRLRDAIAAAVAEHWAGLPPADPAHPLLRFSARRPEFGGSWSVRFVGGGFHISHIHSHGVLSSACYLVTPPGAGMDGWLEIAGAPQDIDLPLKPLMQVEPRPGRVALFPSYLFHGTRPFKDGERLSVAFDVVVP